MSIRPEVVSTWTVSASSSSIRMSPETALAKTVFALLLFVKVMFPEVAVRLTESISLFWEMTMSPEVESAVSFFVTVVALMLPEVVFSSISSAIRWLISRSAEVERNSAESRSITGRRMVRVLSRS